MNNNINTYNAATASMYEALSICEWNLSPLDPNLLQIAKLYALLLVEGNRIDTAIVVLSTVIQHALEELRENDDKENKLSVELIITDLTDQLTGYQIIADRQEAEVVEL